MMKNKIKELSASLKDQLVDSRRYLHQYPELAFEEFKTAAFIKSQLDDWGISYRDQVAKTGVVAEIKGLNPDKETFVLRADMDGLPIRQENDVAYKSLHDGKMHACGHDVHTTCVLGACKILNDIKAHFQGTVRVLFQPSEEKLPGGASVMIKEGVLENPVPSAIIGQHVFPELEAGKIGFRSGMYMASCDELYFKVIGKGGHAALPHKLIDPIEIAAQIVLALKALPDHSPPQVPTVLSIGKIEGLGATNVVPNDVYMEGTLRTMDEAWRAQMHHFIKDAAETVSKQLGGECEVRIEKGYPYLKNDECLTHLCENWAKEFLGEDKVVEIPERMTAEDFAYYTHHLPGCFYRLGVKNEALNITSPVHTSTFDVDEKCLEVGASLMAFIAYKYLNQ